FRFQISEKRDLQFLGCQFVSAGNLQSKISNLQSLYGRPALQMEDDLAYRVGQRSIERAASGALMAASTKAFRDARYIDFPLAAQADAIAAIRQLAEKCRHLDAADGEHVVHQ